MTEAMWFVVDRAGERLSYSWLWGLLSSGAGWKWLVGGCD